MRKDWRGTGRWAVICFFGLIASPAMAQTNAKQPAELPPDSFTGSQFVDSAGCAFIRAGIDGNVSWVPRVDRARQQICGQEPTFAVAEPQVAEAPPDPPAAPVEEISDLSPTDDAITAEDVLVVAEAAPAPQTVRPVEPRVVPQPQRGVAPRPTVRAAPAPRPQPVVRRIVRGEDVTRDTRMVPRHVSERNEEAADLKIPAGYEPAWDDGRLNPKRAEQTPRGMGQMLLIWTETLPRRLIDPVTGRDLTGTVPLVYPYTNLAEQEARLGRIAVLRQDGKVLKRIEKRQLAREAAEQAPARQPVISTRSAPVETIKPVFVQVGRFAQETVARQQAQGIARLGLPARIGKSRRGGRLSLSVQAGPFLGDQALRQGLARLQKAGFETAIIKTR